MDNSNLQAVDYAAQFADINDLETFYERVESMNVLCGWRPGGDQARSSEPVSPYKNAHWKYAQCRAALEVGSKLISSEGAGRRMLNFRNPIPENDLGSLRTMLNAYQLILPGERAPSHRHTPHALRVILDAKDMYSVVEGEKTLMETGDVVLTPSGMWHAHEHVGDQTACWVDGLDVPLVALLQVQSWEPNPDGYEKIKKVVRDSPMRFAGDDIQRRLDEAKTDADGFFAKIVELETPDMPTLGLRMMRLESGEKTRGYRTNANTSFVCMKGSGVSTIQGEEIHWNFGDVFVAPTWRWIEHHANEDAQIFSMSDAPLLRFAKYYRFEAM